MMSRQILCGTATKLAFNFAQRPQLVATHARCPGVKSRNHCNDAEKTFKHSSTKTPCLSKADQTLLTSVSDSLRHQSTRGMVRPNLMPTRSCSTKPLSETGSELFVQGVQGDDCTAFLTWVWRCRKYGLENCEEQLSAIKTGKKTLGEVLQEQEKLIVEVAKKYKKEMELHAAGSKDYIKEVENGDAQMQYIQSPCPQGIQGDDCTQFKLWLEKCHQFGFRNCIERLNAIRVGDQSLEEIFADHDNLIKKIVKEQQDDQEK